MDPKIGMDFAKLTLLLAKTIAVRMDIVLLNNATAVKDLQVLIAPLHVPITTMLKMEHV